MSYSFAEQYTFSTSSRSNSDKGSGNDGIVGQIASDLLVLSSGVGPSSSRILTSGSNGRTSSNASSLNSSAIGNGSYPSAIEQAVLKSSVPVESNENEEITVSGQRGLWLNKAEVTNWRGPIDINKYPVNEDGSPEVINKKSNQSLEYVQELAIKYLRPPTPPPPGEIVIVQQGNSLIPPAPPLVIRQQPPRPETPTPLVVREAPPQPPTLVGRKVITISGRRLPPPPRKVVIERLPPLPAKPQSVLIERWLPYAQVKRRVVFQGAPPDPVLVRSRNVVVQWEAPQVNIKKEIKYLGVVRANPAEYVQKYGSLLKSARDLPQFVLDIKTPDGVILAADQQKNSVFELEGDLQALRLVDLEREGLSEYKTQLQRLGIKNNDGESNIAGSSFEYSPETLSSSLSGPLRESNYSSFTVSSFPA